MAGREQPIIIKRKKIVVGAGHHGGAWKVAYADFVTAMMAFFLLMWLLNATTEDQRKGLADYFNPSIPISRISGGGSGALKGSSVFSEDTFIRDEAGGSSTFAAPSAREDSIAEASHSDQEMERAEAQKALESLAEQIEARRDSLESDELAEHIRTRMTPDGLIVELLDGDGTPLFEIGSARPSRLLDDLLEVVAPVLATAENKIQIIGHTDARIYSGDAAYSNWELSSERASIARRLLVAKGFPEDHIVAVIGRAATEPLSPDPLSSQNRRIAVLLLADPSGKPRPH